jgi:nucleoside-diphosphate-sugar epimerase
MKSGTIRNKDVDNVAITSGSLCPALKVKAADLAEWLWTLLLRGADGRTYNVGSDEAISILDLARLGRECAGTQNEILVQEEAKAGVLPARYVPSAARVRQELGLSPRYSLSDAIRRTIAWHRNVKEKGVEN